MAVITNSGLMKFKDKNGNIYAILPITTKDNVDGLEGVHVRLKGITTAGTGSSYTATVEGIDTLETGITFIMIPHIASTAVNPTLDVNGLGAKSIRRRVSGNTATTVTGSTENWISANKPIMVTYDGTFWIVDFDQPNVNDLYGTLGSDKISYDNTTSGLTSTNVKEAIDEVAASKTEIQSHISNSDIHVTAEEKASWNAKADASELESHTSNNDIHVTAEEKAAWNEKATTTYVTEQIEAAIGSALGGSY